MKNNETIPGSTDATGLFTAENPYEERVTGESLKDETNRIYQRSCFEEAHPRLFCYNENNQLVKGVEGLEVKPSYRWKDVTGKWDFLPCAFIEDGQPTEFVTSDFEVQACYIAVQPTEKAGEYTYTIDGKPCTEKQYHDTEYASNFIDVGHAEKHHTPLPEAQPLDGVKTAEEINLNNIQTMSTKKETKKIKSTDELINEHTGDLNCQKFYRVDVKDIAAAYHAQFATDAGGVKDYYEPLTQNILGVDDLSEASMKYAVERGLDSKASINFSHGAQWKESQLIISTNEKDTLTFLEDRILDYITGSSADQDYNDGLKVALDEIHKLKTGVTKAPSTHSSSEMVEKYRQALSQIRRVEMLTPESEAMINKLLNQ